MCVVCGVKASATLVPPNGVLKNPTNGKTVYVSTMRLCAVCRADVVDGRVQLGWSWSAERWGCAGTKSSAGDTYVLQDSPQG